MLIYIIFEGYSVRSVTGLLDILTGFCDVCHYLFEKAGQCLETGHGRIFPTRLHGNYPVFTAHDMEI